jgi:hypothetical protein
MILLAKATDAELAAAAREAGNRLEALFIELEARGYHPSFDSGGMFSVPLRPFRVSITKVTSL